MRIQEIRICLKELSNESFEGNKIYVGVRIKKIEFDLDAALLDMLQRTVSKRKKESQQPSLIHCLLRPLPCVLVFALALWIVGTESGPPRSLPFGGDPDLNRLNTTDTGDGLGARRDGDVYYPAICSGII